MAGEAEKDRFSITKSATQALTRIFLVFSVTTRSFAKWGSRTACWRKRCIVATIRSLISASAPSRLPAASEFHRCLDYRVAPLTV